MDKRGLVFDISRCCVNDGPGIRTTVFLKGCPLKCIWCHNPESQSFEPEILYSSEKCVKCGTCVDVCTYGCHTIKERHIFDRQLCVGCGKCSAVCRTEALRLAGKYVDVDDVMKEVLKDRAFYEESGGGLTISGGEPLMQLDFLESLLKTAKQEGIHTCVETCGYASTKAFERIAPITDCFLYDWKESNPDKHFEYTGADNYIIRENLEYLNKIGAEIILRMPLIPGYNDTKEHIKGTAQLVRQNTSIKSIEIMPYHPLGLAKAKELNKKDETELITVPDKKMLNSFLQAMQNEVSICVSVSI